MTTSLLRWAVLTLSCLALPSSAQTSRASVYSPPEQLRAYALSTCLANAFPNTPEGKDAAAAASGYLELGSSPLEAYPAILDLAKQFLARHYQSQSNASLHTMECIDLYHSPQLTQLIRKYTANPARHGPG